MRKIQRSSSQYIFHGTLFCNYATLKTEKFKNSFYFIKKERKKEI